MNFLDQKVLVDYTHNGGNLVIFPNLPDREMSQNSCTTLRNEIGIQPNGTESIDSPLVDVYDFKDIKCANPQIIFAEDDLKDAIIIARTIRGSVCGFEKTMGKGSVIHLGTWLGFDTEGHKPVYEALLEKSGAKLRQAYSNNENITVRERFTPDKQAVLFVGNYYNEEQFGKVTYTHPKSGENFQIPYSGKDILWPPLYSILTPVFLEITEGITLLHCTSDILNIEKKEGQIEITLFGDRDLMGELVLEGAKIAEIKEVQMNGNRLENVRNRNRVVIHYNHLHQEKMKVRLMC
jgi:beta-galactosidase